MAYDANRSGSGNSDAQAEKQRSDQNNAKNVQNAADVAMSSGNPYAMAAGGAVKAADKITGGKASAAIGKAMTQANKHSPLGKKTQNASNKLAESGASDKIGTAARMKNGGAGKAAAGANNSRNVINKSSSGGGQQAGSSPSSGVQKNQVQTSTNRNKQNQQDDDSLNLKGKGQNNQQGQSGGSEASNESFLKRKERTSLFEDVDEETEENQPGTVAVSRVVRIIIMLLLPTIIFIGVIIVLISAVVGILSDYDDALGVSSATGQDTGEVVYAGAPKEQEDYYTLINDVELSYLANGIKVDSLKIAAVFHILNQYGADLGYDKINESMISEVADSMLSWNIYSESTFKENLKNNIIPKYIRDADDEKKDEIVDAIFDYLNRYYSFIGKKVEDNSVCAASGSCSYDIKGFYINGKGNVSKNMQISNLYVRLMQCGVGSGHDYGGTFGQPLEGEELVPFEKYILGVAYQEIGPSAPAEAIKAQMVAARSYILARHADMGGWRTLQQESDGKWVLQAASCTQDQVYCDPDQGCSGTDGQWGQVYSGQGHGSFSRGPMPQDSPLRTYASQTNGELIVNSQGYIVYAGYAQGEQEQFTTLANSGLNYKQILLQVYNQGSRGYGASDITRSSCSGGSATECRISSGEFINWRQTTSAWSDVPIGSSGRTIGQIGCLATSVSMLIAKSGVQTNIANFNPGTFVEALSKSGGFDSGGNFIWGSVSSIAPSFKYQGKVEVAGLSKEQKLAKLKDLLSQQGVYVVAEVKGNTGQHWVAIDSVNGDTINMMDPGSSSTNMWAEYNWANTSQYSYYKVG